MASYPSDSASVDYGVAGVAIHVMSLRLLVSLTMPKPRQMGCNSVPSTQVRPNSPFCLHAAQFRAASGWVGTKQDVGAALRRKTLVLGDPVQLQS